MSKKQVSSKKSKKTIPVIVGIVIIAGIGIVVAIFLSDSNENDFPSQETKNPRFVEWLHVHGLGISHDDPSILYIATHGAFYQSISGAPPVQVDNKGADYMGFSSPPTKEAPMYSSGHPAQGGNTGLIKSTDGGRTWNLVSTVLNPPVDFHAMTVSKSNPSIILGFDSAGRGLFKTTDAGKTWESLEYPDYIMSLAISPNNSELIFAGTGKGLYSSSDGGNNWTKVINYKGELVLALAFDGDILYAASRGTGIDRSFDFGQSWERVAEGDFLVTSLVIDPTSKDIYIGGQGQGGTQEVYKLVVDELRYELIGTNRK